MRVLDRLSVETEEFHPRADEDIIQLLGPVTATEYRQFLVRTYSFVAPLERALASVRGLDRAIDARRFRKSEMLRIDLLAFGLTAAALEKLPQWTPPKIESIEDALGWVYPIERSTLGHNNVYRHLAAKMPGEVAFAASYLKCYFGVVGESWKSYGDALEAIADSESAAQRVIDCACAGFRAWRTWQLLQDEQFLIPPDGGIHEQEPA